MIDGVVVTPLKQISDERGKVMHMLRRDWDVFEEFGEIYFSTIHPGVIKAWHIHKRMKLNYAAPLGKVRFVLFDGRQGSPTKGNIQEVVMGPDNYRLVTVPPMIWNGFKGLGDATSIVANCATIPHDPDEIERLAHDDPSIPYDWSTRHG